MKVDSAMFATAKTQCLHRESRATLRWSVVFRLRETAKLTIFDDNTVEGWPVMSERSGLMPVIANHEDAVTLSTSCSDA